MSVAALEEHKAKYAIHEACREGQSTPPLPKATPHHLMQQHSHINAASKVESLLSTNPKLSTLRDPDDRLPLHWAVSYNHLPIVTLLMQQQAKTLDVDATDSSGWTALHMACSRADSDAVISLLVSKDADANARTSTGATPLHFCASKNNLDAARLLMGLKPPASARLKDKRGQLPVHRAAAAGNVPMMKALLEVGKSPVNAQDADGWTPLHHAVSEGHGDAALLLLQRGAEGERRDQWDKVALDYAPDAKTRDFVVRSAEREGIDLE
ncbi:hypothetical protein E8E13_003044 [Curvularia kusanoi]|uniref:Uncharacterized protein n=1 Tax=Curvularia kusanoi TaxID=90978 RepID=A0A9P4T6V1_CURKU|nr:hypothetical protein E8E13_003044 [Curvularia kusanoi]